eukprot:Nk52_evm5s2039 gene=Nk52_evmTU5s2039
MTPPIKKDKLCQYSSYLADSYSQDDNPSGFIELAYAENRFLFDTSFVQTLQRFRNDISIRSTRYEFAYGSPELRSTFSEFWKLLCDVEISPKQPLPKYEMDTGNVRTLIFPDELVMVSGCLSAVEILLASIITPGDGVLIPAPMYGRYAQSVSCLNRGIIVPAHCCENAKGQLGGMLNKGYQDVFMEDLISSLQSSLNRAKTTGVRMKAMIITNPHNPLNLIITPALLVELVEFAEKNSLHLICDEIFAPNLLNDYDLPMADGKSVRFVSMLKMVQSEALAHIKNISSFVHVVTGLGKVGFAGWKVGALWSRNIPVVDKCRELSFSRQISTDTQFMVQRMLSDKTFRKQLLDTNSQRLMNAYHRIIYLLSRANIPFQRCYSGLAILIDFRCLVSTFEEESQLQEAIFGEAKVLLDRGENYLMPEPGWFRIVFAAESSLLETAVTRVKNFLEKRQDHNRLVEMSYRLKFEQSWKRSDWLFGLLTNEGYLERPIGLRFPFIFYEGHLVAFNWKQFIKYLEIPATEAAEFDNLFERGIDPDVETGECHQHSADLNADKDYWPGLEQVHDYRDSIRKKVLANMSKLCHTGKEKFGGIKVLDLCLEHELMHQETLLYMFTQLDKRFIQSQFHGIELESVDLSELANDNCLGFTKYIVIPPGSVTLGGEESATEFKWDIETPENESFVESFSIRETPITIREFVNFVEAGGYSKSSYWLPEDWAWKEKSNLQFPASWAYDEESGKWVVKTVTSCTSTDLVPSWPVYVSLAEARAYCCWKGNLRLPTEQEYHRATFSTGMNTRRTFPWGEDAPSPVKGNFGFYELAPSPVHRSPEGASFWGLLDTVGNGWELTESIFGGLPGYRANIPTYPGYSADFFDDKHYVVCGASWATDLQLVRNSFRNWYQAHYPYVFAKFRPCLKSLDSSRSPKLGQKDDGMIRYHFLNSDIDSSCSDSQFANDVISGLSLPNKKLHSVYFYDDKGSKLFSEITDLEEYYLTRTELGILKRNIAEIGNIIGRGFDSFNLVELGAGDGTKTEVVISELLGGGHTFDFIPIDISCGALESMANKIYTNVPSSKSWRTTLLVGDNMDGLKWITENTKQTNIVMFLGSSIGNFEPSSIVAFLAKVQSCLRPGDYLLIGFDLKKDARVISDAYYDKRGVTAEFNLNLLDRINKELNGNFNKDNFEFHSSYEAHSGDVNSYLVSTIDQTVALEGRGTDAVFHFKAGEAIQTECSRKFFLSDVHHFADQCEFEVVRDFMSNDPRSSFVDSLWRVKQRTKSVLSQDSFERYLASS